MTTRTIVTSHPELPCDVCGRRLLRGERPDVFLAGDGRRLTVCELCTPRAAHEGWRRESAQADDLGLGPARPRRARNLLGRLRQLREPAGDGEATAPSAEGRTVTSASAPTQAMAEEFEPVQPPYGAIERSHSIAAPVAAPALGEVEQGAERSHHEAVQATPVQAAPTQATPVQAASTHAAPVQAAPAQAASVQAARLGAEPGGPGEGETDEPDEPAEEGSWRDAWMFVEEYSGER